MTWKKKTRNVQYLKCSALKALALFQESPDQLPVPPTRFNYMMWEAGESLLSHSDCSPPGALRLFLPRWWWLCPASHQLNYPWYILPRSPVMTPCVEKRLSGCAFEMAQVSWDACDCDCVCDWGAGTVKRLCTCDGSSFVLASFDLLSRSWLFSSWRIVCSIGFSSSALQQIAVWGGSRLLWRRTH